MLRVCLGLLCGFWLTQLLPAAQPGFHAEFIGGTLPGVAPKSAARLDLARTDIFLIYSGKQAIEIPYNRINSVEYGQNVSRRYAEAVLISPVLLLAKSRKHFVTIDYTDPANAHQVMVFRIDKGDIRSVLAGLEAHSGRRIEYQDNEARKAGQ